VFIVILALAVVAGLVVTAAVIDLKARRRKVRYDVDPGSVRDHRRTTDGQTGLYPGGGGY